VERRWHLANAWFRYCLLPPCLISAHGNNAMEVVIEDANRCRIVLILSENEISFNSGASRFWTDRKK
jgi:hypothetical protein